MILVGGVSLDHVEAVGTWQWCNFLGSLAAAGKQVVRINLDETCWERWLSVATDPGKRP